MGIGGASRALNYRKTLETFTSSSASLLSLVLPKSFSYAEQYQTAQGVVVLTAIITRMDSVWNCMLGETRRMTQSVPLYGPLNLYQ